MKRILRIVLGVMLVILGLVALVTPLTPGSWLVPIGLELLGLRLLIQRKLLSLLPAKTRITAKAWLDRLTQNRWFQKLSPRQEPDANTKDQPH